MSDPMRFSDQNAGDAVSLLLASARVDGPNEGAEQRVLAAVGTTLLGPAWAATGGNALGPLGSGVMKKLVVLGKWTALGATAALGALTATSAVNRPSASPSNAPASARSVPGLAPPEPAIVAGHADLARIVGGSVPGQPLEQRKKAALNEAAPASRPSRLAQEVTSLDVVRSELRANRANNALALLAKHSRDFPNGRLAPETDLLRIQALMLSGDRVTAARLAEQFLTRYPSSSYSTKIRELMDMRERREQ